MTIDWMHRAPARAKIRVHVKRLLKKYGYPPDLQDSAVQNVLRQAEALSTELVRAVSTFDGSVFTIFDGRRGAPQELRVLFVPGTHRRECKNAHNA
jgi:hypothetical protein